MVQLSNFKFSQYFNKEAERLCTSVVEDFRSSKISKPVAHLRIHSELKGRTQLSPAEEFEIKAVVATYFEMLDKITSSDRRNAEVEHHDIDAPPRDRLGSPSHRYDTVGEDRTQTIRKRRHDDNEDDSDDAPDVFGRKPDVKLFPTSWNEELDDSVNTQIRRTMQLRNNYAPDLVASCLWVTSCGRALPFPFAWINIFESQH